MYTCIVSHFIRRSSFPIWFPARLSAAHKQEPRRKSCRVILGRAATAAGGKQSSKRAWEMELRFGSSASEAQKGYLKGSALLRSERWEITVTLPGVEFIHVFLLI